MKILSLNKLVIFSGWNIHMAPRFAIQKFLLKGGARLYLKIMKLQVDFVFIIPSHSKFDQLSNSSSVQTEKMMAEFIFCSWTLNLLILTVCILHSPQYDAVACCKEFLVVVFFVYIFHFWGQRFPIMLWRFYLCVHNFG